MEVLMNKPMDKEKFWINHIQAQANSSMTQKTYCTGEGIKLSTFFYWKNRLKKSGACQNNRAKAKFLEIPLEHLPEKSILSKDKGQSKTISINYAGVKLEIEMSSGMQIHIGSSQ